MTDSCGTPFVSNFPVQDPMLDAVEHSMEGAFTFDNEGNHVLVGGDYSFQDLMDFLSGYDPNKVEHIEGNMYEYVGGPIYSEHDVIRALIQEVRRLRLLVPEDIREPS